MTTSDTGITLFPSAAAACALPMLMGLVAGVMHISLARRLDWLITLPLSLCFLCGTPLAAWLACRYLRKSKNPEKILNRATCCGAGVAAGTKVHFIAALAHIAILLIVVPGNLLDPQIPLFLLLLAIIHFCLWAVITLPFTILCAMIFWGVTKAQNPKLIDQTQKSPELSPEA